MSTESLWKDRLTFVSGTILFGSIILLKLWPFASQYNTGIHISIIEIPKINNLESIYSLVFFIIMVLLLSLGVSLLSCSIFYIIFRGIWLVFPSNLRSGYVEYEIASFFDKSANFTFLCLILAWILLIYQTISIIFFFVILYFPLSLLAIKLGKSPHWLFLSLVIIHYVTAIVLPIFFVNKIIKKVSYSQLSENIIKIIFGILVIVFLTVFVYSTILTMCYTASIGLDKTEFKKEDTNYFQTHVILGGATSDYTKARLALYDDQNKLFKKLLIKPILTNKYISSVNILNLKQGDYILKLQYPHYHLSNDMPFIKSMVEEVKYFRVIP